MAEVFNSLGIYGIPAREENLILQSLVTGDPMLMISEHGAAKTAMAKSMAGALGVSFAAYDAAKSMFEDMLGMPNPAKMQQGEMDYIRGPMTIWDKEFVFIDEVNRATAELQSKWLEVIRSRQVMGFELATKFVWGAMNPMGYEGAQLMDEAYSGRFSTFVYIPCALDMTHDDRVAIIDCVGLDDAPALGYWGEQDKATKAEVAEDPKIKELLKLAQQQYSVLSQDSSMEKVSIFLSKFAPAIYVRTKPKEGEKDIGVVKLDGRRLGMMKRTMVATRAIEIAKANLYGTKLGTFIDSAAHAIQYAIPSGVNAQGGMNEEATNHISNVFQQLQDYFDESSDLRTIELTYELMVSDDMVRKTEILLQEDLKEITKNAAWERILESTDLDVTVLSVLALQMEIKKPGLLPANVVDQMGGRIDDRLLRPEIPPLQGGQLLFYSDFEKMIAEGKHIIEKLMICHNIKEAVRKNLVLSQALVKKTWEKCAEDIKIIRRVIRVAEEREVQPKHASSPAGKEDNTEVPRAVHLPGFTEDNESAGVHEAPHPVPGAIRVPPVPRRDDQ